MVVWPNDNRIVCLVDSFVMMGGHTSTEDQQRGGKKASRHRTEPPREPHEAKMT